MNPRNQCRIVLPKGFAALIFASMAIAGSSERLLSEVPQLKLDVDATKPGRAILHLCDTDGTPKRPLIADVDFRTRFGLQGTPDVSADGKKVVFDALPGGHGIDWQEARIVVVDIDGANPQDISDGVMPCFSPDGSQLAPLERSKVSPQAFDS